MKKKRSVRKQHKFQSKILLSCPRLNWFRFLETKRSISIFTVFHICLVSWYLSFRRFCISAARSEYYTVHTCRHTLERGVIGVQAKIVGDLIRNYKPLGALCLMHNVFSPLYCGSHRSYPTSLSEIIPRGARRNEINKLRFEKKRKEELLDNRESLMMAFVRKKNNKHHDFITNVTSFPL